MWGKDLHGVGGIPMYVMHSSGRGDGGQWQCFNRDEEEHKQKRRPRRPPQPADIDTPHPHSARHPRRRLLLRRHHYFSRKKNSPFFFLSFHQLAPTQMTPKAPLWFAIWFSWSERPWFRKEISVCKLAHHDMQKRPPISLQFHHSSHWCLIFQWRIA